MESVDATPFSKRIFGRVGKPGGAVVSDVLGPEHPEPDTEKWITGREGAPVHLLLHLLHRVGDARQFRLEGGQTPLLALFPSSPGR